MTSYPLLQATPDVVPRSRSFIKSPASSRSSSGRRQSGFDSDPEDTFHDAGSVSKVSKIEDNKILISFKKKKEDLKGTYSDPSQ